MSNYIPYQTQYTDLLNKIISDGSYKETRNGNTYSIFSETMKIDLTKEFPMVDLKNISFKNILNEVKWFISGDTNIKFLLDNGCNIWNDDAYKYYLRICSKMDYPEMEFLMEDNTKNELRPFTKNEFINLIKMDYDHIFNGYRLGDLGKIYGHNWRRFNGVTDQLKNVIELLKNDPFNRRILIITHNPSDLEDPLAVGLPPCHNYINFFVQEGTVRQRLEYFYRGDQESVERSLAGYDEESLIEFLNEEAGVPKYFLSMFYNMRSNDFFLGQNYNMASYAIFLEIIANIVGMVPYQLSYHGVDIHLYEDHIEPAREFIKRHGDRVIDGVSLLAGSKFKINGKIEDIDNIDWNMFEHTNYDPLPNIKAKLFT